MLQGQTHQQGCALLAQLVSLVHRSRAALLLNTCALPRQPFPYTPSSSEQLRNSKSRMIPSGGLLDKTNEGQSSAGPSGLHIPSIVSNGVKKAQQPPLDLLCLLWRTKGQRLTFLLWVAFEVEVSSVLYRAPHRRSHLIRVRRWLVLFGFSGYHLCFTKPVAIWLIY